MTISLSPLILASRSPRRKELLARLTENFEAMESSFDEDSLKHESGLPPEELVLALAEGKARAVQKLPEISDEAIVIGGDTVVVSPDGEIFGIPKSEQEARSMLESPLWTNPSGRNRCGAASRKTMPPVQCVHSSGILSPL